MIAKHIAQVGRAAVGNDQLVNGDPMAAMVLNAIERSLEGGSRNMTAPQILDHSRGRVLRVVGHMEEYSPSASFKFLLLFPSSEGWVLGKVGTSWHWR